MSPFPFLIGADPDGRGGPQRNFIGTIHGVRFSNVVRYTKDFTPPGELERDADTLLLLRLNEGTGSIARDSSGNGYHADIKGAAWIVE